MYSNLGEKIKLLRKIKKLKQDDLAEVLKLSRGQISNLESGRRNISLKQLEKLCEYFKVDISYFLMSTTTDSCLDLIEKARVLFESKELTVEQKDDLFTSIMKVYIESKLGETIVTKDNALNYQYVEEEKLIENK